MSAAHGARFLNEKILGCRWSRLQFELGIVGDVTTPDTIKKSKNLRLTHRGPGCGDQRAAVSVDEWQKMDAAQQLTNTWIMLVYAVGCWVLCCQIHVEREAMFSIGDSASHTGPSHAWVLPTYATNYMVHGRSHPSALPEIRSAWCDCQWNDATSITTKENDHKTKHDCSTEREGVKMFSGLFEHTKCI